MSRYDVDTRKWGDGYTYYAFHDTNPDYGSDVLTGGTASASAEQAGNVAANAVDNDTGTYWWSNAPLASQWWKYDLGVGNSATPRKLRLYSSGSAINTNRLTLDGSNNDSDWTKIAVMTDQVLIATVAGWYEWFFSNTNAYRYFRYDNFLSGSSSLQMYETELLEANGTSTGEWPWMQLNMYIVTGGLSTLGGYAVTSNTELSVESVMNPDEISQEGPAIQNIVASAKSTFKVNMSIGDATHLAIAAGLIDSTDEDDLIDQGDGGGVVADTQTILLGLRKMRSISMIHKVANPHNSGWFDYLYMPNVQVDPSFTQIFDRDNVRSAEVIFHLLPSTQSDLLVDSGEATGKFASWKQYNQSAAAD